MSAQHVQRVYDKLEAVAGLIEKAAEICYRLKQGDDANTIEDEYPNTRLTALIEEIQLKIDHVSETKIDEIMMLLREIGARSQAARGDDAFQEEHVAMKTEADVDMLVSGFKQLTAYEKKELLKRLIDTQ